MLAACFDTDFALLETPGRVSGLERGPARCYTLNVARSG
jgi:hypothetical protein